LSGEKPPRVGKAPQDGNVQGEIRVVLRKMLEDDED
jgi:hypothetical protein